MALRQKGCELVIFIKPVEELVISELESEPSNTQIFCQHITKSTQHLDRTLRMRWPDLDVRMRHFTEAAAGLLGNACRQSAYVERHALAGDSQ